MLLEGEARHAREAWSHSMNCSKAVHTELQAYRAQVQTHKIQIQTWDTRIGSLETLVTTLVAQTSSLQTQLTTALGRIQTLEARELAHTDDPKDAGSSRVADALVERDAEKSRNGDDNHDSGTGVRRQAPVARECTYSDFHKFARQIKFATCTLQENDLTWWNSHVKTVGHDVAYAMTWKALKKMTTDKYCPRGEIKKLEIELWKLKSDEVEIYVGGLPDMIQGSVMASKPKKIQDAIEFATELMDQKIRTIAERQAKNNTKFDDTSRNNQNQQQPFKRHNVALAYTAGPGEKKPYGGSKPLCPKCNYHHDRQCATKCANCKRTGHLTQDCRSNNQKALGANQRVLTCFECGAQGHFRSNGPKLKKTNQGNQAGNGNAVARAYDVGTAGTNPNSNVVAGTFL
ncbi:putative reverse transcriptase domain-containing protein [Tanacetum coccineum]